MFTHDTPNANHIWNIGSPRMNLLYTRCPSRWRQICRALEGIFKGRKI